MKILKACLVILYVISIVFLTISFFADNDIIKWIGYIALLISSLLSLLKLIIKKRKIN